MKAIKWLAIALILVLAGCNASKPYQILKTTVAPAHTVYAVEVPADASKADLTAWAKELESKAGRETMVNFYNGGRNAKNIIATYQEGKLYKAK